MRVGRGGFSILEVAIAVVVVGLAASAALTAVAAELRSAGRARQTLVASALAEDRLEAIRTSVTGFAPVLPDSLEEGVFTPPLEDYRWQATLRAAPGETSLLDASVTVRWPSGEVTVASQLFRPPPRGPLP